MKFISTNFNIVVRCERIFGKYLMAPDTFVPQTIIGGLMRVRVKITGKNMEFKQTSITKYIKLTGYKKENKFKFVKSSKQLLVCVYEVLTC